MSALQEDKVAIDDAIRTLRNSIRELRGARRPDAGPPDKHAPRRRRHPVLAPQGTIPIVTARGAHNERAVLEYLEGQSNYASFRQIYEALNLNSGTASGVVHRLVDAKLVDRTDFNAYRINEKGQAALDRVRRLEADGTAPEPEPEPAPTSEPMAKPSPPAKKKRVRDSRSKEQRFAEIDRVLREDGGRVARQALVDRAKLNMKWLRDHLDELQREGILQVIRVDDRQVPVGYRVYYQTPKPRETVVKPGEGVAPDAGRRRPFPWA